MQKYFLILNKYSSAVLRLAMASVMLWFSFSQLSMPDYWMAYIPDYAISMTGLTALHLVYANAIFELIFGVLLALGIWIRLSALLLSLHLLEITLVVGYGEIGVRDLGLAIATFVVFMNGFDILSFKSNNNIMESQNKSNKLGYIIGAILIVLVAVIAVFAGRKDDDDTLVNQVPPTTLDISTTTTTTTTTSTTTVKTPATPTTPKTPTTPVVPATKPPVTSTTGPKYKDGIYSATGSYMSPGGLDKIDVTVVLANDIVTGTASVSKAGDRTSERYEQIFISEYAKQVVGKNIADVELTRVSGSSLTPIGFNDALAQIKSKAKL